MGRRISAAVVVAIAGIVAVTATVVAGARSPHAGAVGAGDPYELWTIDQTDSRMSSAGGYGGYLHIYGGRSLEAEGAGAPVETVDLGDAAGALCEARTGARPVRPHMLTFDGGDQLSQAPPRFAILSWVVSGHVTIFDAATREPLACLRTDPGFGGARQAHAAWPTPDGRFVIVANQNGRQVERLRTDWSTGDVEQDPDATLKLFEGATPNGEPRQAPGIRPGNAPICLRPTRDSRMTFVSLRGGGAFVIDHAATPMRIVAEYDSTRVADFGCGQLEARGRMYLDAGAGAGAGLGGHAVYAVDLDAIDPAGNPPNAPAPRLVYDRGDGDVDAHGLALTSGDRHLLVVDRTANDVTVVDVRDDRVVGRFRLDGEASDDPAPDLMSPAPDGRHVFVTLRGPAPLSGGHEGVQGSTPGVGVIRLDPGRVSGELVAVASAQRADNRPADPHAIAVRVVGQR